MIGRPDYGRRVLLTAAARAGVQAAVLLRSAGVAGGRVRDLTTGRGQTLTLDELEAVARVLGVDAVDLVDGVTL